jgi:hypothetical protein
MDYRTRFTPTILMAALAALLTAPACSENTGDADAAPDQALADAWPDSKQAPDTGPGSPDVRPDLPAADGPLMDGPLMDGPLQDGPVTRPDQAVRPDAPRPDAAVADSAPGLDGTIAFPTVLGGIWLMGYTSGGSNHFSWVKFSVSSSSGGSAVLLDGSTLTKNTPYWNCSGSTSWNTSSAKNAIQLNFPTGTCTGYRSAVYTFVRFSAAGSYPKGATLQASVTTNVGSVKNLEAYRFPSSQCNAAMSSCTDPL